MWRESPPAFALEGDFNSDGRPDRAIVGVYRDTRDSTGRFLLILTRGAQGWTVADHASELGAPGFSYVTFANDELAWSECYACDVSWTFKWDGSKYKLVPEPQDN